MRSIRDTGITSVNINRRHRPHEGVDLDQGHKSSVPAAGSITSDHSLVAKAAGVGPQPGGITFVTDALSAFQVLLGGEGGPALTTGALAAAGTIALGDLLRSASPFDTQASLIAANRQTSCTNSGPTQAHPAPAQTSGATAPSHGVQVSTQALRNDPARTGSGEYDAQLSRLLKGYDPESSDSDDTAVLIANNPALLERLSRRDKLVLIRGLFDGNTTGEEERAALLLLHSHDNRDLKSLMQALGRDELESELGEEVYQTLQSEAMSGRERVAELMRGYDPGSSDADEVALRIAGDPALLARVDPMRAWQLVKGLLDGNTTDEEEAAALRIVSSTTNLDNFLSQHDQYSGDADEIAVLIAQSLNDPQRDQPVVLSREKKFLLIRGLFDGHTGEEEERAVQALLFSHSGRDAAWLVDRLGLSAMEDELGSKVRDDVIARLGDPQNSPIEELASLFKKRGLPIESISIREGTSPQVRGEIDADLRRRLLEMPEAQLKTLVQEVLDIKDSLQSEGMDPAPISRLLTLLAEASNAKPGPGLDPYRNPLMSLAYETRIALAQKTAREGLDITPLLTVVSDLMRAPGLRASQKADLMKEALSQVEPMLAYISARVDSAHSYGAKRSLDELAERVGHFRRSLDRVDDVGSPGQYFSVRALIDQSTGVFGNPSHRLFAQLDQFAVSQIVDSVDLRREEGRRLGNQMPFSDRMAVITTLIDAPGNDERARRKYQTWVLDLLASWRDTQPGEMYRIVGEIGYERLREFLGDRFVQVMDGRYIPSDSSPGRNIRGTISGGF